MKLIDRFLEHFSDRCQVYYPAIEKARRRHPDTFDALGETLLGWASQKLGDGWEETLSAGYMHFLMDVNRSQMEYERRGHYPNKSYDEVYKTVYDNPEFMDRYHWGVFVTTFAWEHHLEIYEFFRSAFLPKLQGKEGRLLDLGSGSGVWSLLTLQDKKGWISQGIDISRHSVGIASAMAETAKASSQVRFSVADALEHQDESLYDAGVSCFLLEHLEGPQRLFDNLARNLKPGAWAFVTAALTAAEADHIAEFKKESEILQMVERAGFRAVAMHSAAPDTHPRSQQFLPRSMAVVLQKKHNDIW
ncbi:MAG: class I SAM-dependent methyltransferase [Candidatus Nitrohelix vancouverensis]|uniref:Class I SAM-dependent methyltransferase n=1 Tax=Candidatus Nitrohelix vancouverensis TaxID=2705534 RepID=A0A7T0C283_9BACT|nr:MAG: class I SAM-dependent methyltransferase [Candidatus Nitrohelix vancouverensis]